ncbi:MAG: putative photosynthetic complex assembly protein PuhE [Gammaproteobacteria bacterium]
MTYALPVFVAVALWWLSTIVALYRIGLPASTFRQTFVGISVIAAVGVYAVFASLSMNSVLSAYVAFAGALAIWSWHEFSYYLGYISGPVPVACPEGCTTWERFVHGVKASLYHELAIVVTALLLVLVSWQADNQIAAGAFCIFWIMRWSAKINIFLGTRNVHMEFLPGHLQYLGSYMAQRPMNALFPFSMLAAAMVFGMLLLDALSSSASTLLTTGNLLLATLLGLAALEHVFLMLKIPDAILWRLGTSSRRAGNV